MFIGNFVELLNHTNLDSFAVVKSLCLLIQSIDLSILLNFVLMKVNDSRQIIQIGIDIYAYLIDDWSLGICILKLLWRNILPVLQLLHFANSVYELDASILEQQTNVFSFQPAILIKHLRCHLWVFEVTFEHSIPLDIHFTHRRS